MVRSPLTMVTATEAMHHAPHQFLSFRFSCFRDMVVPPKLEEAHQDLRLHIFINSVVLNIYITVLDTHSTVIVVYWSKWEKR